MARERISFVSDDVRKEETLESKILSGEINAESFKNLSEEEQLKVNQILFNMASEKINPNIGSSTLEFVLFGFMRIMNKKVMGLSLSVDEKEIEENLEQIAKMHQITDASLAKSDWLFDYMGYAEAKAKEILENRKEHIDRKQNIMGTA
jgi:hypothetical protein